MALIAPAATAGKILDIAERLVQTRGYNGFSYADISSELRIRNASVHYHFPSKSDLGRRLVGRYRENFMTALAGLERESPDARRRLLSYVTLWTGVLRNRDRMCLCGMMAADIAGLPRSVRGEIRRFFDENETWLVRVIRAGQKTGSLKLAGTPEIEARLLTMGLEGAMLVARSYGEVRRFEEIAARLLSGLGVHGARFHTAES
ncbi:MAG TPA: TetR/AcrR family transcriptional regulator [Planctomycetota bacterium]|nr:TetR/AcrR family transcriptional regulator [Planctomycetota bacterium]